MTTMLKSPRRLRRARRLRDAARFAEARADSSPLKFDPEPPIEPPTCLKNLKPGERLSNSEHIEALEWLIACIRESARKKGMTLLP